MTGRPDETVVASYNKAKVAEIQRIFAPYGLKLVTAEQLGISAAAEPHLSFIENALAKARHAASAASRAALADDSGLCVAALNGAPGVRSARFAGGDADDQANNRLLLTQLEGIADRAAYYYCAIVLCKAADDPCPLIAQGRWHGAIADSCRGTAGFGYDPLFELADGRTAAQLSAEEKDECSHRGSALRSLASQLASLQ